MFQTEKNKKIIHFLYISVPNAIPIINIVQAQIWNVMEYFCFVTETSTRVI